MTDSEGRVRRKRRNADEWRALLSRFGASGLSVAAFCRGESVSVASFQRWRGRLGIGAGHERPGETVSGFVDLGTVAAAGPAGGAQRPAGRLELTLDLGGGVVLHLVRG